MNIKIDINNCRVCLQTGRGQPLFGDTVNQYDKKYTYITQLPAHAGDGLPELICSKCIARLRIACDFRKQSQTSEQHVRRFLVAANAELMQPADESDDELEARLLAEAYAAEGGSEPEEAEETLAEQQSVIGAEVEPEPEPEPEAQPEPEPESQPEQKPTLHLNPQLVVMPPPPHPMVLKRMPTRAATSTASAAPAAAGIVPVAIVKLEQTSNKRTMSQRNVVTVKTMAAPLQPQRTSARTVQRLQPAMVITEDASPPPPTIDIAPTKMEANTSGEMDGDEDMDHDAQSHVPDDAELASNADGEAEILFEINADLDADDMNEEHLLYEEESTCADDSFSTAAHDDAGDVDYTDDAASVATDIDPLVDQPKAKRARRSALTTLATMVGQVHVCQHCNKDFSTRTNLLRHIQTHDGSKPYKCTMCDSSFTQNGSLKQHMHIHTGIRPFTCEFCGRGFTQSKSMTFHMRRHTGEKPFVCKECGMNFRQKDGLKRHMAVRHPGGNPLEFPCDQCPKVLRSRYSLNVHKRRHSGGGGGGQPADKKVAKPLAELDEDEASDGEGAGGKSPAQRQMFKCEQCVRTFASQASLVAHRRQHQSERETHCPQCDAVFTSRLHQQNHMWTVHGEGPIGRTTTAAAAAAKELASAGLAEAVPVESEMEKPFKCQECGLRFVQDSHRAVHAKTVHGKRCKKFECPTCGKSYAIKANLNAHIARHENDELMLQQENSVEQLDESFEDTEYDDELLADGDEAADVSGAGDGAVLATGDGHIELEYITDEHEQQLTKQIFECGDCNVGFTSTTDLAQHRRDEHGVLELTDEACMCDSCELIFNDIADLEAHIVMQHSDQMVSLDDVAPEETEAAAVIVQAVEVSDSADVKVFKCDRCDLELGTEKALDEHVLEHDLTDAK